jgi:hypothetical protein
MTKHVTRTVAVGLAALVMALGFTLPASAQEDHHHGSHEHPSGHPGSDPMTARDYGAVWKAATKAQRAAATQLIDATTASTQRWADVNAALADGFMPNRGGLGPVHYRNIANRRDDAVLDPDRPESLVYLQRPNGAPILLGAVYVVLPTQDRPTPAGELAAWHVHGVPGCHHPDLDPGCGDVRGGMLHVWTYPGVRDPFADPMFASMGTPTEWRTKLFDLAGVARPAARSV